MRSTAGKRNQARILDLRKGTNFGVYGQGVRSILYGLSVRKAYGVYT